MVKENVGRYCVDCTDKKVGCHIKCFAYNVAYAQFKQAKAREQREKEMINVYGAYMNDRPNSSRKRKGER